MAGRIPPRLIPGGALSGPLFQSLLARWTAVPRELPAGCVVGPYRIVEPLGRGGTAVVYRAERADGEFEQTVALKVIDVSEHGRPGAGERLRRERQILASLHHPHIARLLDGGSCQDRIWFAMEPVRGTRFDRYVRERALPLALRLRLFLDACDAVQFAHARMLVHRDLKPSNIMVGDDGELKLLDFGIAIVAEQDAPPALTPGYASPEQRRGDAVTAASDLWQLGQLLAMISEAPRGELASIIACATRDEPGERYASVGELAADVTRLLRGEPVHAHAVGLWYRARCLVARHRAASAVVAAALVCLIAMALQFTWRVARERDTAAREAARANAAAAYAVDLFSRGDPGVSRGEPLDVHRWLADATARLGNLTGEPTLRAQLLMTLGRLQLALGQPALAGPLFDDAVAALSADAGADHGPLAEALAGQGRARLDLGNPRAALPALVESAALVADDAPASRRRRRATLDLLSMAQLGSGQQAQAIATQREAVALASTEHGPRSAELAASLQNLGIVLRGRETAAESTAAFAQAYSIYQAVHGADHPATAGAQQLYAVALLDADRLAEAGPLLEASVEIQRHLFQGKGTGFAHGLRALGRLRARQGAHRRALELFGQAEAQYRDSGEAESVTLAWLYSSMADSHEALGDARAALAHFERALAIRRSRTPDQLTVAQSLDGCSRQLLRLSRSSEAEARSRESLALRTARLPPDAPDLARSLLPLGAARHALGATAEARALWDRALELAARAGQAELAAAHRYIRSQDI